MGQHDTGVSGVIKGMTLRANPCVHSYREIGGAYSINVGLHVVFCLGGEMYW